MKEGLKNLEKNLEVIGKKVFKKKTKTGDPNQVPIYLLWRSQIRLKLPGCRKPRVPQARKNALRRELNTQQPGD